MFENYRGYLMHEHEPVRVDLIYVENIFAMYM